MVYVCVYIREGDMVCMCAYISVGKDVWCMLYKWKYWWALILVIWLQTGCLKMGSSVTLLQEVLLIGRKPSYIEDQCPC